MTSNRLKSLAKLRLILSVIAVLLACVMVLSGVMHFGVRDSSIPSDGAESETISTTIPEVTEVPETEIPTISTEPEETTEATTEPTEAIITEPTEPAETIGTEESETVPVEDGQASPNGGSDDSSDRPSYGGTTNPGGNGGSSNPGGNGGSSNPGDNGGSSNPGDNSGSSNPGDNSGSSNSGDNSGSSNPGDNSGSSNSGDNSGSSNSGDNSGSSNSGDNSGSSNPGGNSGAGSPAPNSGASDRSGGNEAGNSANAATATYSDSQTTNPLHHPLPSDSAPVDESTNPTTADPSIAAEPSTVTEPAIDAVEAPPMAEPETAPASDLAEVPLTTESNELEEDPDDLPAPTPEPSSFWGIVFWASAALLSIDILAILLLSLQIERERKKLSSPTNPQPAQAKTPTPFTLEPVNTQRINPIISVQAAAKSPHIGTIHQIGRRSYQQDSLGHTTVLDGKGVLAVLADGMGGLSGGEKVSQKIIMDALPMGHQLKPGQLDSALWNIVGQVNENVNRMLGPDGLYKSGSTMVAVLVYDHKFHWISVGDSRIYLYRQGQANQLNQDHDQLQVWMADVLCGRRTMEEVLHNPDGRKLTSFIGMGQLKYVDGSRSAIALEPGDRLVLMSDGIYNVVSEDRLADVLKRYPDVKQAASIIDRMIRENNSPHQDNYTSIILGF